MRKSILISGVAIVAACIVLLFSMRGGHPPVPRHMKSAEQIISPAASPPATVSGEAPPMETAPSWQSRFDEIASQSEYLQSQEELVALADELDGSQIRATLEALSKNQSAAAVIIARELIARWASTSAEDAVAWVQLLPDDAFGQSLSGAITRLWGQRDLASAMAWVQQQPENGKRTAAELALAAEAATHEGAMAAVQVVATAPSSEDRGEVLLFAVRRWAQQDREHALSWIDTFSESGLRTRMLEEVTADWAITQPADAASFAASGLPPGTPQDDTILKIVQLWATSAPDNTAEWVAQFPVCPLRSEALAVLSEIWHQSDPRRARLWFQDRDASGTEQNQN